MKRTIFLLFVCLNLFSMGYADEEVYDDFYTQNFDKASVNLDLAWNSKYVLRGRILVDDPVFQPSLWVDFYGFKAMAWANMDTTNDRNRYPNFKKTAGDVTEIDLVLEYNYKHCKWSLTPGYIHLAFPNTGIKYVDRLYITAAYDTFLAPSLNFTYDFRADGWWTTFALDYAWKSLWSNCYATLSPTIEGAISYRSDNYNIYYYGARVNAFTDAYLGISAPITFQHGWKIVPSIHGSTIVDHKIKKALGYSNVFWYGIDVIYTW